MNMMNIFYLFIILISKHTILMPNEETRGAKIVQVEASPVYLCFF